MRKRSLMAVGCIGLTLGTSVHAVQPVFSLIPRTPNVVTIPSNGTVTVQYTVTNNTKKTRTLTTKPIQGVTHVLGAGLCTSPFELAPNQSCVLSLQLSASALAANTRGGPEVCKTRGPGDNTADPRLCALPAFTDVLQASVVPAPLARRVTVGYFNTNPALLNFAGDIPVTYASADGGISWTAAFPTAPTASDRNLLQGVSCSRNGLICNTVGRTRINGIEQTVSYSTNDGGFTWSPPVLLTIPSNGKWEIVTSVACDDSGLNCTSIANFSGTSTSVPTKLVPFAYVTTDGGLTWSVPSPLTIPANSELNTIHGINCNSTGTRCVAVGRTKILGAQSPLSYTSTDSGRSWSVPNLLVVPAGGIDTTVIKVACSADGLICSGLGQTRFGNTRYAITYSSRDGGNTWSGPTVFSSLSNTSTGISCGDSGLLCTWVGLTGFFDPDTVPLAHNSVNGGQTWSSPVFPAIPSSSTVVTLNAVICDATGNFCTATGSGYLSDTDIVLYSQNSVDGGNTWADPVTIRTTGDSDVSAISGSR